ncbi:MAG: hypothetical protein DPW21_07530 [Anaerolineae bacterium]|nr:GNAT family N-acetyltransferase [Chloroflexi bacterium CFX1]MCQ3946535.1 hypothetical protein [Anaerolineae bacterium]
MIDIEIKKMSLEMVDSAASLHMIAFQGYTNTLIGMPYVQAFIRWFFESEEAVALCAVDDSNRPVGYVVGAPLGYGASLNKRTLLPALVGILLRPWLIFNPRFRWIVANRLRSWNVSRKQQSHGMPTLPGPTLSLVGIGVHPDAHGQGVGLKLITAFESYAIEMNAKSMRLSVYPDKIAARQLYTKAGWKLLNNVSEPLLYYYKLLD